MPGGRVLPIWIARGVHEKFSKNFRKIAVDAGASSWDILARNWPVKGPGAEAEQPRADGQIATSVIRSLFGWFHPVAAELHAGLFVTQVI